MQVTRHAHAGRAFSTFPFWDIFGRFQNVFFRLGVFGSIVRLVTFATYIAVGTSILASSMGIRTIYNEWGSLYFSLVRVVLHLLFNVSGPPVFLRGRVSFFTRGVTNMTCSHATYFREHHVPRVKGFIGTMSPSIVPRGVFKSGVSIAVGYNDGFGVLFRDLLPPLGSRGRLWFFTWSTSLSWVSSEVGYVVFL